MSESKSFAQLLYESELLVNSFPTREHAFFFYATNTGSQVEEYVQQLVHQEKQKQLLHNFQYPPLQAQPPQLQAQPPQAPPLLPPPPPSPQQDQLLHSSQIRPTLQIPSTLSWPIIVFDTETVGLSPPIICQLAFIHVEHGRVVSEYDQLLQLPPNVKITETARQIHGISEYDCRSHGVDAVGVLSGFVELCRGVLSRGGRIIAHNSAFDARAINMTIERWGASSVIPRLENAQLFCTMRKSKSKSPLLTQNGKRKAFKNGELYNHLFGVRPDWARLHSAYDDVMITALNYVEGIEKGWW